MLYFVKQKIFKKIIFQIKIFLIFHVDAFSGFTSMMITYPLETTRTYLSLQTNKNKYKGIFDALRKIPPKQLYQGCKMSMYGFGGFSGIQYTSYYYINRIIKDTSFDSKLFAGAFAWNLFC